MKHDWFAAILGFFLGFPLGIYFMVPVQTGDVIDYPWWDVAIVIAIMLALGTAFFFGNRRFRSKRLMPRMTEIFYGPIIGLAVWAGIYFFAILTLALPKFAQAAVPKFILTFLLAMHWWWFGLAGLVLGLGSFVFKKVHPIQKI